MLERFLARVGLAATPRVDLAMLRAIVWGQVTRVPFENLDILLGRGVRIDLPSIDQKLLVGRRGGYCFEQNTLLAAALRAIGFEVTTLAARVRWMATGPTPRSHMLLAVDVPGAGPHLVDAGFGGTCPTAPIPLRAGETELHHDHYRLVDDGGAWTLQLALPDGWADLYRFTLEPQLPVDYEVSNWFTSTSPTSHFTRMITVARTTPEGRLTLRGRELSRRRGERELLDDARLLAVLADDFDLHFPPDTRFP